MRLLDYFNRNRTTKYRFEIKDLFYVLLLSLCIGQFAWLAYENLFNIAKYIGFDPSMNLLYGVVAAKQGRLIATNFECTTSQFYTPFVSMLYKITDNIFVSQALVNIIGISLAIIGACLVLSLIIDKNRRLLFYSIICTTLLIMCPFAKYERSSIDFGAIMSFPVSYYLRNVLLYIFVIWGMFILEKKNDIKGTSIFERVTLVIICFSLICKSTAGYEFITINIIIPLLLYIIIEVCIYNNWRKAIEPKSIWIYLISGCVFVGVVLNSIFVEHTSATSEMHWISLNNFMSHIGEVIVAYVDIAGGLPGGDNISVFSISGFSFVSGLIIIALLFLALIFCIVKLIKAFPKFHSILPFVVVFLFCTSFYSLFDLTYEQNRGTFFSPRYLCIAFVSLFFIFAKFLSELDYSKIYSKIIIVVFIVAIIVMTVFSDYYKTTERKELSRLDEIKSILDDNAPESKLVYFVGSKHDDVRLMRVWDTDRVYKDIWSTGELFHWGDYTYSDEASDDQGVYVIFCNKECVDTIPPYVSSRVERIGEWDDYNIYIGEETVYDFKTSCDGKIGYDFPYSPSVTIDHMEMNEKGEYISDGSGNIIVYGPNYHFKEGIYDITLEYEVIESKDNIAGAFDMVKDEKELFTSIAVTKDAKTVGFYDVPISEETWLQYRVGEAEGTVLKINKVVIKNKNK